MSEWLDIVVRTQKEIRRINQMGKMLNTYPIAHRYIVLAQAEFDNIAGFLIDFTLLFASLCLAEVEYYE